MSRGAEGLSIFTVTFCAYSVGTLAYESDMT